MSIDFQQTCQLHRLYNNSHHRFLIWDNFSLWLFKIYLDCIAFFQYFSTVPYNISYSSLFLLGRVLMSHTEKLCLSYATFLLFPGCRKSTFIVTLDFSSLYHYDNHYVDWDKLLSVIPRVMHVASLTRSLSDQEKIESILLRDLPIKIERSIKIEIIDCNYSRTSI